MKNQLTNYKQLILTGHKIHTIRTKIDYWTNIIDKINNKEGYLSLREWEGIEYQSRSIEFLKVYECGTELIQKIDGKWILLNTKQQINEFHLAENDGLNLRTLNYYFPNPYSLQMLIIHFTAFRYEHAINAISTPIKRLNTENNQLNLQL
jgi:hypothetical protein